MKGLDGRSFDAVHVRRDGVDCPDVCRFTKLRVPVLGIQFSRLARDQSGLRATLNVDPTSPSAFEDTPLTVPTSPALNRACGGRVVRGEQLEWF